MPWTDPGGAVKGAVVGAVVGAIGSPKVSLSRRRPSATPLTQPFSISSWSCSSWFCATVVEPTSTGAPEVVERLLEQGQDREGVGYGRIGELGQRTTQRFVSGAKSDDGVRVRLREHPRVGQSEPYVASCEELVDALS